MYIHTHVTFLDVDLFKSEGTIHTKEHCKVTSSNLYLRFESAHPQHTFPGIAKSQLYRIRRLCSRDADFEDAVIISKRDVVTIVN